MVGREGSCSNQDYAMPKLMQELSRRVDRAAAAAAEQFAILEWAALPDAGGPAAGRR